MLAFDSEDRLKLHQIKNHPWMKGKIASKAEICDQMQLRYNSKKTSENNSQNKTNSSIHSENSNSDS